KRRFGSADRQLRVGLQRQQAMLDPSKTVAIHSLSNLRQSLLAFAGDAERPSVLTEGHRVILRDVLLLADPQSPSGIVGDRRWFAAKDVNERGPTQRLGEGEGVPERLGTSYCCPELLDGPIRVTEHPGNQRRPELACHAGM